MAEHFTKGGQDGWYHDPGYWGGFFHSYHQLQLRETDTPRQIHIFLPRDYEVSQARYPVLYMNDGNTAFFPGGAYHKTWDVATLLTRLYLSNAIRRVIVVAVCPINRDYEYTHAPVWDQAWGGLPDYATYLATSLKGFIDSHYRTLGDPHHTVILGSSHGGLAAFYTAVKYPHCFGNVAAMSPSLWVGVDSAVEMSLPNFSGPYFGQLQSSVLMFEAEETLRQHRIKIYLDWGLVREGGQHNAFIEERATARGRDLRDLLIQDYGYRDQDNLFVVEDPLGEHQEESWAGRLDGVLRIFFGT